MIRISERRELGDPGNFQGYTWALPETGYGPALYRMREISIIGWQENKRTCPTMSVSITKRRDAANTERVS